MACFRLLKVHARVVVDWTLRRRGGGDIGALCSSLRLDAFEGDAILRRETRSLVGDSTARVVLWDLQVRCQRGGGTMREAAF